MKSILLSILLIILLSACGENGAPTTPILSTSTVNGKVINYVTDMPVEGVYVSTNPLTRTTKTESDGAFLLEDLEDGEYEIILQKFGYEIYKSAIKVNESTTKNQFIFPLIPDSSNSKKPVKPELISPLDNAIISTNELSFRWFVEDIEDSNISFSLYFGTSPDGMNPISTNLKSTTFIFSYEFQKNTSYYWKVVSTNLFHSVSSDVFKFEYGINNPPDKPELIYPAMDEIIHSNEVEFNWSGNDIDGDELLYDLYLGISKSKLFLLDSNLTSSSYIYNYNFNETDKYYWRIDAKDNSYSVESDIFEFTYKDTTTVNENSLIGFWKLNGNAFDSGPNDYDGEAEGVTYVEDRLSNTNSAANFSGNNKKDSKVLLSSNIMLKQRFTIALWVKQAPSLGENSNVGNFDCFSQWGGSGVGLASYNLGIDKNKHVYFTTYGLNGEKKHETFNEQIEVGTWYHLAITFNNGTVRYYLNGIVKGIVSGFPEPQLSELNPSIGGRQDQLSSFHGAIDDVILYERVLSDQEIKNLAK